MAAEPISTSSSAPSSNKNMSVIVIIGIVVLLALTGLAYWMMKGNMNKQSETTPTPSSQNGTTNSPLKQFTMDGSDFSFSTKEIRVKQGDTVQVTFNNKGGMHDWNLDEFNAHTPIITAGNSATVEFKADKTGTFEYYCSVMNHRQMGMVGKLIVE